MTALFMDSFDHYGTGFVSGGLSSSIAVINNMQNGGWSIAGGGNYFYGVVTPSWGPARTGPYAFYRSSGGISGNYCFRALPNPLTHMFLSVSIALTTLPTEVTTLLHFRTLVDDPLYSLQVLPNGSLRMYNTATNTVMAVTGGGLITPQTWYFLEMELNTAGNWVLRVDDASGADTPTLQAAMAGGTIALLGLGGRVVEGATTWFDDVFIRDTNGTTNNGWLGDRRIATLFPNEDTADDGWTPSFYKQISPGIAVISSITTGLSATQEPNAIIKTAPATALNIGNQDFTLETFIRFDRLPMLTENFVIFNKWNESNPTGRSYQLRLTNPSAGGNLEFRTSTDGSSSTEATKILYPWSPEVGQWYHLALVRVSGELLLFVDGAQLGLPIPDTDTYFAASAATLAVGGQHNSAVTTGSAVLGTTVIGRLDETRFTNGVGRYTSSFTPPTTIYPRGISDPDWASVVLLMGYDITFADESSFARPIVTFGASVLFPQDGDPPGAWTAVGKQTPDDNTYIRASFTAATNILTMVTNPADTTTVTAGTSVYKFVNTLVDPYDVLIGATAQDTLTNLLSALNGGAGEGTVYGTGTLANTEMSGSGLPAGQFAVTALVLGTSGNSIPVGTTSTASWLNPTTLLGGLDIPGKSSFGLQRPPTNTTIISAVQLTSRARKTDSGAGTIQASLIGPLGAIANGPTHGLSTSTATYHDIIELDPDTSGPISPTTLINGRIAINRTA